jgi:hypothetical protein
MANNYQPNLINLLPYYTLSSFIKIENVFYVKIKRKFNMELNNEISKCKIFYRK